MTEADYIKRLAELERRVLSLEGKIYHSGAMARAVREVVSKWPGPFTAMQIRDAVYELQPDLKPPRELNQVHVIVGRMEKAGQIVCTFRGAGPTPNIYKRVTCPPAKAGVAGARFGRKDGNESGFSGIMRAALEDLPMEFTIEDLKKWVGEKLPSAKIPAGTWSSTLFKMQTRRELVVLRNGGRSRLGLKVFGRGPRRISPTGDEVRQLEEAWKEFRKSVVIPDADFKTVLQRNELSMEEALND
jgi:hypothetical protein